MLPGVHSFADVSGFSFSGVQMLLARLRELDGDALHLGGEAVERRAQAQVLAQPLVGAALAQPRDGLVEVRRP